MTPERTLQEEVEALRKRVAELEEERDETNARCLQLQEDLWVRTKAMDAAVTGITISDPSQEDNPLIYINDAFEKITGYPVSEVLGHNCRFLQGDDTDPDAPRIMREAIEKGEPCNITLLNYRKDGTPFWNELYISPVRDSDGNITNYVGIQMDVTERKETEIALRESEARMAGIISSAMDGIVTVDEQQNIVLFNPTAEQIFGYQADEVIGKPLDMLIPEEYREQHHQHVHDFGDTDTINRFMAHQRTVWALRSNGERFPIEASISQVEAKGHILFTAIVRDVTERKRAEEEQRMLQEEVMRMQQALLQELSTPLIPISDEVVVMPLIGSVDTLRAQNVMGTLLHGVEKSRARTAILDITGVPVVDTQVANTLIQSAQAVQLLGAEVVLTGIGPEIAQTLVGLGVELPGVVTRSTLQDGIAYAMRNSRRQKKDG
jgi:PAS domain S-box-containing protein